MAVGNADKTHAGFFGARDRFFYGKRARQKREAATGIDQRGGAFALDYFGFGFAVRAAFLQVLAIQRHARQAVPTQPLGFGGDQCLRRGLRHDFGCTGTL